MRACGCLEALGLGERHHIEMTYLPVAVVVVVAVVIALRSSAADAVPVVGREAVVHFQGVRRLPAGRARHPGAWPVLRGVPEPASRLSDRPRAASSQVIQLFKLRFDPSGLGLYLYPYRVLPSRTGAAKVVGGIIECVPDVRSRDEVRGVVGGGPIAAHLERRLRACACRPLCRVTAAMHFV